MVIVRPRAIPWDLLPLGPGAAVTSPRPFWETSPVQAAAAAERLAQALEQGSVAAAAVHPAAMGFVVLVEVAGLPLVVCGRVPGQPYQPLALASEREAGAVADHVTAVLAPAADRGGELYVNTRQFAR
jgi:hypothetical protein